MSFTVDEIYQVAKENNISIEQIEEKTSLRLFKEIVERFTTSSNYSYPLWEKLTDKKSLYDPEGWKLLVNYRSDTKKLLFIELNDSCKIFMLNNSYDLVRLIENSFGFIFYVTGPGFDFLICFNDHDYLICCGDAKKVIDDLGI